MGGGTFTNSSFASYSRSVGKVYDTSTNRVVNQVYTASRLDESLNPRNIVRECANSKEHPNTIPVILGLDVTGSMGSACKETAEALGEIMTKLYKKFDDVEFSIMGIGDLAYDKAPIQMSQFESDVRIAEALDKVWIEGNGGGNDYESYTSAWYMGLNHTKLDAFDKQGRKGIIITMGDEPLNPYLPSNKLYQATGDKLQGDVETKDLYESASKKFDIFHIAVDSPDDSYRYYKDDIKETFGKVLGNRLKVSTINKLSETITDCIKESIENSNTLEKETSGGITKLNENHEITW